MSSAAGSAHSAVSQKAMRSDGSRREPGPSKRAYCTFLSRRTDAAFLLGDEFDAASAVALDHVHLAIGHREQLVRIQRAARRDRDADARADRKRAIVVDEDRLVEAAQQFMCRRNGRLFAVEVFEQQHELVAGEARDRVGGAHLALKVVGERDQQPVAVGVAVRVVDVLEVVEIDEEHRTVGRVALGARDGAGQPLAQQRAIGQVRQRVVER